MDNKNMMLSYDDISLVPRVESTIDHRSKCNTSVKCFGTELKLPIMSSPMPDVTDGYMARTIAKLGCLALIHRFITIEEQVHEYKDVALQMNTTSALVDIDTEAVKRIGCAIGATGDYKERFIALHDVGCRIFCIDTANGFHKSVSNAVKWIKSYCNEYKLIASRTYIIAGNVATAEGYAYLTDLGVDGVRVGIAGGSACITRTETGVYYPMASSILECIEYKNSEIEKERTIWDMHTFEGKFEDSCKKFPLIIADGGVRMPADVAKAIALGADLVMAGGIFAGSKETPGDVIKDKDGRLYKLYRGAASFSVQKESKSTEPAYNEGAEMFVPYKSSVDKIVARFHAGLQSSMSYMNSINLTEFKTNCNIIS